MVLSEYTSYRPARLDFDNNSLLIVRHGASATKNHYLRTELYQLSLFGNQPSNTNGIRLVGLNIKLCYQATYLSWTVKTWSSREGWVGRINGRRWRPHERRASDTIVTAITVSMICEQKEPNNDKLTSIRRLFGVIVKMQVAYKQRVT
ncbi:unnamed protein product [Protopolystoma xenopodis]|uniref:Uncharacterized protein n=1 Tax=Protopolystoma xenopodis TaxID=117903 RepID=A0A448XKH1_9PLAT|nr:unnamed protein product [Protopolystoma xenopodis]